MQGHCWRSRDELISDELLWTTTHGRAKAGRPARTYIQQLCEDTGCSPEDLPEAMNDYEKWRERVRDIRATSTTWGWWWWWFNINYNFFAEGNYLTSNWYSPEIHRRVRCSSCHYHIHGIILQNEIMNTLFFFLFFFFLGGGKGLLNKPLF